MSGCQTAKGLTRATFRLHIVAGASKLPTQKNRVVGVLDQTAHYPNSISSLKKVNCVYSDACPNTPAEKASQPMPPQAPNKPFVGSKLKPKYGESK
jgi:hypothetical protein